MRARILVVEDNRDNLALIDYLLTAFGYTPLLTSDGAEGVRMALEERPDLILLDIRMPEMDGYEALAEIRQHPELEGTPAVAVTASVMAGDRHRIVSAGFDGLIRKPIDPETFIGQVERFLAEQEREQQIGAGGR